jgi:hypothetical protein
MKKKEVVAEKEEVESVSKEKESLEQKKSDKKDHSHKKNLFPKEKWIKRHRRLIVIIIVILVIILAASGTQLGLWINFMLGNDVIISLNVDKEYLLLENGQEKQVNFEIKIQTNPFCRASCSSELMDISHNREIDRLIFNIRPGNPHEQSYVLRPYDPGKGKELYRFSISCHGQKSTLCHTSEENISRSILITLDHDLNEEEKALRSSTQDKITFFNEQQAQQQSLLDYFTALTEQSDKVIIHSFEIPSERILNNLQRNEKLIEESKEWWNQELYASLSDPLYQLEQNFKSNSFYFEMWNESLNAEIREYENLSLQVLSIQEQLMLLKNQTIISSSNLDLNQTIFVFNHKMEQFNQKSTLVEKRQWIIELQSIVNNVNFTLQRNLLKESAKKILKLDADKQVLCQVEGTCLSTGKVKDYLRTLPLLENSCQQQQQFLVVLKERINNLSNSGFTNQDEATIYSVTKYLQYLQLQEKLNQTGGSEGSPNFDALLQALNTLMKPTPVVTENQPSYTLAILTELEKQQGNCSFVPIQLEVDLFVPLEVKAELKLQEPSVLLFKEAKTHCPLYGKEQECCSEEECDTEAPIIFVHGHAFNKDVSTEYSLDAFEEIQSKLSENGYVNAGAVSGYQFGAENKDLWKTVPGSFTFRGSYYYDFFEVESQYSLVQTKSENIDTYAIRLRDMIDWVKYKTGRPKVIIVAHSMGGLVSRRYIQVFGIEDVKELIMIGTPNYGVTGDAADYCPLIGEQLECRDMGENSLFLNKLNREKLPNIPVTNIVGVGCDTEGKDGDGIVIKDKAELQGIKNYYIKGNCTGTDYLHNTLLKVNNYPHVYEIVKEALMS